MSTMTKVMPASVKTLGERTFETVITTGSVDRERDVIDPAGWKLDNYMRGGAGVVLWAHDYHMPPVAKALSITRTATGLRSVDQFPPKDIYPFADTIHDLVAAGVIRAKSVGFIPLRKTWNATREGWDIHEAELLEHSYVSIPANPEALVVARGKAFDRAKLGVFFVPHGLDVTKTDVLAALREEIRRGVDRGIGQAVAPVRVLHSMLDRDDFDLAAIPGENEVDDFKGLTAADVLAALREVVGAETGAGIRRAVNSALGRID